MNFGKHYAIQAVGRCELIAKQADVVAALSLEVLKVGLNAKDVLLSRLHCTRD